jgi:hypothetical protein
LKNIGLKVTNIESKMNIITYPFSNFASGLIGFWFLDDYEQYIGVAMSGSFQVYNTWNALEKCH